MPATVLIVAAWALFVEICMVAKADVIISVISTAGSIFREFISLSPVLDLRFPCIGSFVFKVLANNTAAISKVQLENCVEMCEGLFASFRRDLIWMFGGKFFAFIFWGCWVVWCCFVAAVEAVFLVCSEVSADMQFLFTAPIGVNGLCFGVCLAFWLCFGCFLRL